MARTKKRKIVDVDQNYTIEESRINRMKRRSLNIQKKTAYLSIPTDNIYFSPEHIQYLKESYHERSYHGAANHECQYCGAIFWHNERIKSNHGTITYSLCCKEGKIRIPPFKKPPEFLANLLNYNGDSRSKHFIQKIRQYNRLFAFTSMGANIDKSINQRDGPYVFCINGQIHHRIGSLLPKPNDIPRFAELYIFDTENEISNRIRALQNQESETTDIDPDIVKGLMDMLDQYNPLVKKFRFARDLLKEHDGIDVSIRIIGADKNDPVQFEMPNSDELALLIVGDVSLENYKRDIIVCSKDQGLHEISILHPAFMALQYPLLFPYGERGYQLGIFYYDNNKQTNRKQNRVTMHDYFKYQIHYRKNQPNPYLCYGRLSKQIIVDARACEDEDRLQYIAKNQDKLRVEYLQGIADAVEKGILHGDQIGKKTLLPSSHTGCRRYMIQNYHDGIAICRVYGPPDLFITFTCNPK